LHHTNIFFSLCLFFKKRKYLIFILVTLSFKFHTWFKAWNQRLTKFIKNNFVFNYHLKISLWLPSFGDAITVTNVMDLDISIWCWGFPFILLLSKFQKSTSINTDGFPYKLYVQIVKFRSTNAVQYSVDIHFCIVSMEKFWVSSSILLQVHGDCQTKKLKKL
jgi:hypothetical protein